MKKTILVFGISGTLFAGYLSAIKFFTSTCALNEACPYFWGYPACYYGFVMFASITVVAILRILGKISDQRALFTTVGISFLGILFAGYFTLGELPKLFSEGLSAYFFGLPTCALGLIFFVLIFGISSREYLLEVKKL